MQTSVHWRGNIFLHFPSFVYFFAQCWHFDANLWCYGRFWSWLHLSAICHYLWILFWKEKSPSYRLVSNSAQKYDKKGKNVTKSASSGTTNSSNFINLLLCAYMHYFPHFRALMSKSTLKTYFEHIWRFFTIF